MCIFRTLLFLRKEQEYIRVMRMKQTLTPYRIQIMQFVISGILCTASLIFSVLAAGYVVGQNMAYAPYFLMASSLGLAGIYLTRILFKKVKGKWELARFGALCGLYIVLAVLSLLYLIGPIFYKIHAIVFLSSIIVSGVFRILGKRKLRTIVFGLMCITYAVLMLIVFAKLSMDQPDSIMVVALIPLNLAIISFGYSMTTVFSRIRGNTMMNILRKTYAIEILYGLVILMVSIAMALTLFEESMASFGDALWYCFAVVTTIGFGDITATTIIGRVLSVILGIYGIIVVALITSIIVNFYNEAKAPGSLPSSSEEGEKIEEPAPSEGAKPEQPENKE